VELEDALLRKQEFQPDRQPGFQSLAEPAAAAPQPEILGELLADGGGAPRGSQAIGLADRATNRLEVEAAVAEELLVLRRQHGPLQLRADGLTVHPLVMHAEAAAIPP